MPPLSHDASRPLEEHIAELRRRLGWCLLGLILAGGVCYLYVPQLLHILTWPLQKVWAHSERPLQFIYTHLAEGFVVSLRIALWGGIGLSLPLWVFHVWRFIAPGLYRHEKRWLGIALLTAPFLFAIGSIFAYGVILPSAWAFLGSFQHMEGPLLVALYPRLSEYIEFVTHILLAFGLCFQFPLVLIGLFMVGIVTLDHLVRFRRYSIVAIFFVAAVITPPDVFSQVALALPLIGLYETTVMVCRWLAKFR